MLVNISSKHQQYQVERKGCKSKIEWIDSYGWEQRGIVVDIVESDRHVHRRRQRWRSPVCRLDGELVELLARDPIALETRPNFDLPNAIDRELWDRIPRYRVDEPVRDDAWVSAVGISGWDLSDWRTDRRILSHSEGIRRLRENRATIALLKKQGQREKQWYDSKDIGQMFFKKTTLAFFFFFVLII